MKVSCPICSNSIVNAKKVWQFEFSELIQCTCCGLVFHLRNDELYEKQVFSTYTKDCWGHYSDNIYDSYINSEQMKQHLTRMEENLIFFSEFMEINEESCVLDVGAGMGLLEVAARNIDSPLCNTKLVMIEPVPEIYQMIRNHYPSYLAINGHINQIENPEPVYDVIFCQGVDYLFGDLNKAYNILHGLLKPNGVLLISRNVFIDMPCYFGGEPIRNGKDLFAPNPLINAYFIEEHFRVFLEKNFNVIGESQYKEEYGGDDLSTGIHFNYVLKKKSDLYDSSPLNETIYKTHYDTILKELF